MGDFAAYSVVINRLLSGAEQAERMKRYTDALALLHEVKTQLGLAIGAVSEQIKP